LPNTEPTCTTYQFSSACIVISKFAVQALVIQLIMRPTYGKRLQRTSYTYELPLSPHAPKRLRLDKKNKPAVRLSTSKLLQNVRRLDFPLSHPVQLPPNIDAPSSLSKQEFLLQASGYAPPDIGINRKTSQRLSQLVASLEIAATAATTAPHPQSPSSKTPPSTGRRQKKSTQFSDSSLSPNVHFTKHKLSLNPQLNHGDKRHRTNNYINQIYFPNVLLPPENKYKDEILQTEEFSVKCHGVQTGPIDYCHGNTQTESVTGCINTSTFSSVQEKATQTDHKQLETKPDHEQLDTKLDHEQPDTKPEREIDTKAISSSYSAYNSLEYIFGGSPQKSVLSTSSAQVQAKSQCLSTFIRIIGKDSQGEERIEWEGQLGEWIQGLEVKIANREQELYCLKKDWMTLKDGVSHAIRIIEHGTSNIDTRNGSVNSKEGNSANGAYVVGLANCSSELNLAVSEGQCTMDRREEGQRNVAKRPQWKRYNTLKKKCGRRVFISEIFDLNVGKSTSTA
jgi:hypothetical protein